MRWSVESQVVELNAYVYNIDRITGIPEVQAVIENLLLEICSFPPHIIAEFLSVDFHFGKITTQERR